MLKHDHGYVLRVTAKKKEGLSNGTVTISGDANQ
jgi:hypothetical protein